MPTAFTITVLLVDGRPDGLRLVYRSNWNGLALNFARADWPRIRKRPEFGNPGAYVLEGDDGVPAIYVGEADPLEARLTQHYRGPLDFWTRATAFVSQGSHLNKAIIEFLEAELLILARAAKRVTVVNANKPSHPSLSAAVQAEAEGFMQEMLPILPLLGIDAFEAPTVAPLIIGASPRLSIERSGVVAFGRDEPGGFVVEAGSTARLAEQASMPPHLTVLRHKLRDDGVLIQDAGVLRLTQDYVFASPSNAAGTFLGRAANGRTEWSDGKNQTLKQLQEKAAAG
jgi:hypothetical protein